MISFNAFIKKHNLKNKATSNIKIQQVFSSLGLSDVGIFLKNGPFLIDIGLVNLHPSKAHIGFVLKTKIFLIVMNVSLLKNYLNLL